MHTGLFVQLMQLTSANISCRLPFSGKQKSTTHRADWRQKDRCDHRYSITHTHRERERERERVVMQAVFPCWPMFRIAYRRLSCNMASTAVRWLQRTGIDSNIPVSVCMSVFVHYNVWCHQFRWPRWISGLNDRRSVSGRKKTLWSLNACLY